MWWLVTWNTGKQERIFTYDTDYLCKLIWVGKIVDCQYDDKYKNELPQKSSD